MSLNEVFLEIKRGDQTHFNWFYENSKKQLFYNILSYTKNYELSEDLLQETYVKFLTNIKNIDDKVNVLGYLMVMSKNITLDYFKKNNRIETLNEEDISFEDNKIHETMLVSKIKEILNDIEFKILILHILGELTFNEIKDIVKKPLGTVLWIYNKSLKKVRKELNYEKD
ncbi:MAG: sigma-70 family RNA polymerase sigma factor [Candidatus Onthovivens sp.]|nr:sigma-70 family RNA polymerase sigma factor [Mollicutes bacterium]MCI7268005.1 sigma-70 family RNA polymerase sigma factor [Mollicutes bacterium]MDD7546600.1 sigma-70 family RNA polymerase sigma factor [Bacilli bacterium]MDY4823347.1 sigma-70 family RNA polymerase sigma factor [Candidatus Onthovivens sp.]MDY6058036.1 sigma-70 family RNA polymerase sigma factor [Candidatus Onthovivens sp.]